MQTGTWVGSDWMILGGLKPGDRVVLDNLLKLRPGASVTPVETFPAESGDRKPGATRAGPGKPGETKPSGTAAGAK